MKLSALNNMVGGWGDDHETRVSATPESLKLLREKNNLSIAVVKNAGAAAGFSDDDYKKIGGDIIADNDSALAGADIVTSVMAPTAAMVKKMKPGAWLIAPLNARQDNALLQVLAGQKISAFALEMIPRISRAQNMDILSSQSNLAGYRAVLLALQHYGQAAPMMMTAAGTLKPAKFLIMGVGVAGLQAIATAKRLGGVVMATDVRPDTKEQVESLGGQFLAVMDKEFKNAQTAGGYAKPMSAAYQKKQQALIMETLPQVDIVITTALIPGRAAPQLLTAEMVKKIKTGAVVVDMAVESGGNVAGNAPDKIVETGNGVKIVPGANLARLLPASASALFAKNIVNFIGNLWHNDEKKLVINLTDDIIKGSLVAHDGKILLA
ncbi:MAG: NAD(P) transhydrogenase subunit alpha [Hydrotalea sp.]|nr:NAD(P) transhydrogenase subunit alpha [Hydrotalea sp.]